MANDLSHSEKLALAIGKVTMAWTSAHEMLFRIFQEISGMTPEASEAVFFSLKSDRAQRTMALAVAETALTNPDELNELKRLIRMLDRLAGERNKTVHTMWHGFITWDDTRHRVTMKPRSSPAELAKLAGSTLPDYAVEYKKLAVELQEVGLYLFQLWNGMRMAYADDGQGPSE